MVGDSVVDEDADKTADMLTVEVSRVVGMLESVIVGDTERLYVGDGDCDGDTLPLEERVAAPLRETVSVAEMIGLVEPETVNETATLMVAVELTLSTEALDDAVLERMGEPLDEKLNGDDVDEPDAHTELESMPVEEATVEAREEAVESSVQDSEGVTVAILDVDTDSVEKKLVDTDPVGDLGSIDMLMVALPETVGVQLENNEAELVLDAT